MALMEEMRCTRKAVEVGLEMEPEAPAAFVHEAAPVVAEKDVLAALEGRVRESDLGLNQELVDDLHVSIRQLGTLIKLLASGAY
jgi:hypothetical protein